MPQILPEVVLVVALISTIVCFMTATNISDNLKILRRTTSKAELSSEQHAEFRATEKRVLWLLIAGCVSLGTALGALALT